MVPSIAESLRLLSADAAFESYGCPLLDVRRQGWDSASSQACSSSTLQQPQVQGTGLEAAAFLHSLLHTLLPPFREDALGARPEILLVLHRQGEQGY